MFPGLRTEPRQGEKMQAETDSVNHRDIGIAVSPPTKSCDDENCPFHGHLKVRGMKIVGKVVSAKAQKTIVVRKERMRMIPKYERIQKSSSRYAAHLPPCIDVTEGDEVMIMECRPLTKRVSFVVVENRGGA